MTLIILGSRSPRRLELLGRIVAPERIQVLPPRSDDEASFEGLDDWASIRDQIQNIARDKCHDVLAQWRDSQRDSENTNETVVVAADTVIVVTLADARLKVLGQPPDEENWKETVRDWFRNGFAGKTHVAATALCVASSQGEEVERVVTSEVTFHNDVDRWLDWYLDSGEPKGKAGGYALQGAGDIFIAGVKGSQSNVIGLPLRDLMEIFQELGIDVGPRRQ